MTHAVHEKPRIVLGDDCEECLSRAERGLDGLAELDETNLRRLASIAEAKLEARRAGDPIVRPSQIGASYADMRATETLRLAARIVEKSGIDPEAAR